MQASTFIQTIEERQGLKIAYWQGWITAEQLQEQGELLSKNGYGQYLLGILEQGPVP